MSGSAQSELEGGEVVLGRFEIGSVVDTETLGTIYRATDSKTQRSVGVLALAPILTDEGVKARLRGPASSGSARASPVRS